MFDFKEQQRLFLDQLVFDFALSFHFLLFIEKTAPSQDQQLIVVSIRVC